MVQKVTNPGCFLRKPSPCAQNVLLRVTGLGGDGGGRGARRVSCGRLGYLWATWAAHAGAGDGTGLRRLRAQAIRAAGAGDGVTGAGGVVRDDRRTRRQKAGDGQAHLLPGAPEESRTRRQNGGRGYSSGLCYCWRGMVPGSCTRWACLLNHVFLLMVSPQALAPGGRTTVPVLSGAR